ncbi:MAG TPA: hypothetical protein VKW09_01465 [bacterium]|nr:hypothetical protein [bacterium]
MLRDKDLEQYRRVVEEAVANTGRDDIGVGAVSERTEGVLTVEFSRGTHRHSAEIPVAELRDHESARRSVTSMIRDLSKLVAQEQLEKAT